MFSNPIGIGYWVRQCLRDSVSLMRDFVSIRKRKKIRGSLESYRPRSDIAVIVCGGPSFNADVANAIHQNRDKFDVFGMNFYNESLRSEEIIPDYYVLSDPIHVAGFSNEAFSKKNERLFGYINYHKIGLFAPFDKPWLNRKWSGDVYWFNDVECSFWNNISPLYPRGYRSNTAFKAIAMASYGKYKKIFITGLDYNYPYKLFLDSNGKLFMKDEHHYGNTVTDLSQDYEGIGHALAWLSLDYISIKKLSAGNIINISENSLIDAFNFYSLHEFETEIQNISSSEV